MIKNSLLRLNNAYKKYGKNIKIQHRHKEALNGWYEKYETGKLKDETQNYINFQEIILKELLGYKNDIDFKFNYPLDNRSVEFMIMKNDEPYIPIELKGTDINLDKSYRGGLSPVEQSSNYANKKESIKWFIVSNYYEFRLYNQKSQDKYIQFNLDDLKHDENILKDFLLVFSKIAILDDDILNKLYDSKGLFANDYNLENEFYKLYSQTRLMLIKELEYSNNLSKNEAINYAQLILNRYIFICFCEDKDLLPDNLSSKEILTPIRNKNLRRSEIWQRINGLFIDLYDGNPEKGITDYNGGLFKEDLNHLKIRDKIEEEKFYKNITVKYNFPKQDHIIKNELKHYPTINKIYHNLLVISSFNFDSDIDVNILGHIFENSISDIEEIKEEKTTKRKKDGVYYTPEEITTYICENTIIPYLSKNNNNDLNNLIKEYKNNITELEDKLTKIKIIDPACGSGAFLNKTIDILLNIHKTIHKIKHNNENNDLNPYFDNIEHRKNILLNNIYGVDKNKESIEITKLSLFLKIAQKENKLPNLDKNIKCGNSLIDNPEYTDNPFDWKTEFKEVFNNGGFDIVIGNPPYVRPHKIKEFRLYLKEDYTTYDGLADLYVYFFEKGISLLKDDGYLGYISSNKYTRANYGKKLRNQLLKNNITIYNDYTGEKIFQGATVDPSVIIINKTKSNDNKILINNDFLMEQNRLDDNSWAFEPPDVLNLKDKIMKQGTQIKDIEYITIHLGIRTGLNEAFIINEETKDILIRKDPKNTDIIKPILRGRDIKKYYINYQNFYLLYIPWEFEITKYPYIEEYLLKFKDKLSKRPEVKENKHEWYCLSRYASDYVDEFEKPKILWSEMVSKPSFIFTKNSFFLLNSSRVLTLKNKSEINLLYLSSLFNSKLLYWYFIRISYSLGDKGLRYIKQYVEQLPLIIPSKKEQKPLIDLSTEIIAKNKQLHTEIESFHKYLKRDYDIMINKKLLEYYNLSYDNFYNEVKKQYKEITRKESDKLETEYKLSIDTIKPLQNEIFSVDNEIDQLVYELYNLTEEEIAIIEKS